MNRIRHFPVFCLCVAILTLVACAQKPKDKKIVATVNDSDIPLTELQESISCSLRQFSAAEPDSHAVEDQLETMIERKLMIQEAMRRKLSESERFQRSIKDHWEQTLIRELVDELSRHWAGTLRVTADEISREYRRMERRLVIRAARTETRELAELFRMKMQKGERVDCAELLGPSLYDDLRNSPLRQAFDLGAGETMIIEHEDDFIAVQIQSVEKTELPPINSLKKSITESLMEHKKQQALSEWVAALKRASKITVNKEMLKAAGSGR